MDELASIIGALPDWKSLLLSDPALAMHIVFGPTVPYQYRLNGPHTWSEARQAILQCSDRVAAPTRTRPIPAKEVASSVAMWLTIAVIAAILAYIFL